MVKIKKVVGRPWPKGTSGNPKGSEPLPPEVKFLRDLEKAELTESFSELFRLTLPEIKSILENKRESAKTVGLAKSIHKWTKTGDFRYVQPYFAYIFGLPKSVTEVVGKDGKAFMPSVDLSKIPIDVLKALAKGAD